jgi:hypothetical protein
MTTLKDYIKLYSNTPSSINWDECSQFEKVYFNNYILEELKKRENYLSTWENNIGKAVYRPNNGFNYTLVEEFSKLDMFNKKYFDVSKEEIFTLRKFKHLKRDYFQFQVDRLILELTERAITSNSTSPMQNFTFQIRLEAKQVLISIFKELCKN